MYNIIEIYNNIQYTNELPPSPFNPFSFCPNFFSFFLSLFAISFAFDLPSRMSYGSNPTSNVSLLSSSGFPYELDNAPMVVMGAAVINPIPALIFVFRRQHLMKDSSDKDRATTQHQ